MKLTISELLSMPVFVYADEFPYLDPEEEKELAQDLETNGQQHPIIIYQGQILDGRNRLRAFKDTNIKDATVEYFEGTEFQAVEKVRSLNILRRHLTVGQRAHAALAYLPYEEAEAKKRMALGGQGGSEQGVPDPAPLDERAGKSRNIVAEKFNLSGQRISEAKNLALNAPDLSNEVKAGTKSLDKATRELKVRREERDKKIHTLETEAPDLYTQYIQGKTPLDNAYITLVARQTQKKRDSLARSEALYKIQGFAKSAETVLQEFNLQIIKIKETGFIDEALEHISDIEGFLAVTRNALNVARTQILAPEQKENG